MSVRSRLLNFHRIKQRTHFGKKSKFRFVILKNINGRKKITVEHSNDPKMVNYFLKDYAKHMRYTVLYFKLVGNKFVFQSSARYYPKSKKRFKRIRCNMYGGSKRYRCRRSK